MLWKFRLMIYDVTSSLYQRRPLPPQTFQPSEKPKLQVNYVYFPERLKWQQNYSLFLSISVFSLSLSLSLVSLFKMLFNITDIHVNSRIVVGRTLYSYACKTWEMALIQSMLSDKKYFALKARKDKIRDYLPKFK